MVEKITFKVYVPTSYAIQPPSPHNKIFMMGNFSQFFVGGRLVLWARFSRLFKGSVLWVLGGAWGRDSVGACGRNLGTVGSFFGPILGLSPRRVAERSRALPRKGKQSVRKGASSNPGEGNLTRIFERIRDSSYGCLKWDITLQWDGVRISYNKIYTTLQ